MPKEAYSLLFHFVRISFCSHQQVFFTGKPAFLCAGGAGGQLAVGLCQRAEKASLYDLFEHIYREGNIDADWWANNPEQRVKLHVSAAQFARYDNYLLRFDGSCSRTAAGCAAVLYGAMGSCTNDSDLELLYLELASTNVHSGRSRARSLLCRAASCAACGTWQAPLV